MMMTNYMEILMSNEPWNLIAFMVLPVAMAELLTASELFILARPAASAGWKRLSHGLALAKQYVEMQHGKISVSSLPAGGTCFCIRLPKL